MQILSRRKFLRQGSIAAAAGVFAGSLPQRTWADPLGRAPGIQLYTVGDELQKDVLGTLMKLRAIGYPEAETYQFPGYNARSLRADLDKAGLRCPSAHLPMDVPDLGPVFEEAKILGAGYAVSSTLLPNNSPIPPHRRMQILNHLTLDGYHQMAKKMNHIGQLAKRAKLQYAYHNHNFEFRDLGGGKIGYDILLKETDPDLVDFELDCGWMFVSGHNPVRYFRRYPHRYKMIHVKDFVKNSPIDASHQGLAGPQGTELGRGIPDYRPILAAAAKAGVKHYFVEQEPPFLDMTSLEAAKIDYEYLHAL